MKYFYKGFFSAAVDKNKKYFLFMLKACVYQNVWFLSCFSKTGKKQQISNRDYQPLRAIQISVKLNSDLTIHNHPVSALEF